MAVINLVILNHRLIQQKLYYSRDNRTRNLNFRTMLNEISGFRFNIGNTADFIPACLFGMI